MRISFLSVLALAAPFWNSAAAQGIPVGGWIEDYARVLQLTGQLPLSPVTVRPVALADLHALTSISGSHGWRAALETRTNPRLGAETRLRFEPLPVELNFYANTSRPWGWNDGAVWQGKAVSLAAQAGGQARWGPVSLTFAPLVTYSANVDTDLSPIPVPAGLSPFAYPVIGGGTLDAPQRFGTEPVRRVDWGNTNLRVDWGPVAIGFSHESLWWGPGRRNDILLTNNAPGFWHAHLSLIKPVSVGIGTVSGRWIWGSLRESAFFDTVSTNDRRYMTGAAVAFVPRWAKGLELGAARLFLETWDRPLGLKEIFYLIRPVFKRSQTSPSNPTGEDNQDQVASVFARWTVPASGLELYGEWAKGDHNADLRDLFVEPEHGSAYLFGLQKVVSHSPARTWRFASEVTLLGGPRTAAARIPGAGFFYVHTPVVQGYTHRGQVLGAGIGPGSSQLSLELSRFAPWGSAGLTFLRTVYDNDRFLRQSNPQSSTSEVEPSLRANAVVFRGAWDFSASVTGSILFNQWYQQFNDPVNVNVSVSARFHPKGAR